MKRSKKGKHYFTQISNGIKYTYFIKKIKIKNKYYTITAKSKEDWDLKYENKVNEVNSGIAKLINRNMTMADIKDSYLKKSERFAPSTYLRKEQYLRKYILPEFKNTKIKDIDDGSVKDFYEKVYEIKNSINIIMEISKVLNTIWDYCIEEKAIIKTEKPDASSYITYLKDIERRTKIEDKVKEDLNELDQEEITYILKEVQGRAEEIIYHLQTLSGLRISEALAMTFENIDLDNNVIKVDQQVSSINKSRTKGTRFESEEYNQVAPVKTVTSNREAPLVPPTRALILDLVKLLERDTGLLFTTKNGDMCSRNNWNHNYFNPLMKKLGFSYKTHDLRKFFGSFHISKFTPIQSVSKWLGHSRVSTTYDHYAKVINQQEDDNKWKTAELVDF
jgi:integrase